MIFTFLLLCSCATTSDRGWLDSPNDDMTAQHNIDHDNHQAIHQAAHESAMQAAQAAQDAANAASMNQMMTPPASGF